MTKQELIAMVLLGLGMLICIGTVGDADFNGMWADEYYIRIWIGITLMAAAIPVSGDIKIKERENEDTHSL